jgi:hypothetical protein
MTLVTYHDEPNYVAIKDFVLSTPRGNIYIESADAVSLSKNKDGDLFFGNSGTVIEIKTKTALSDLLSRVRPASFNLGVEEDGEMCLVATIHEGKTALLDHIKLVDIPFADVCNVDSIRDSN